MEINANKCVKSLTIMKLKAHWQARCCLHIAKSAAQRAVSQTLLFSGTILLFHFLLIFNKRAHFEACVGLRSHEMKPHRKAGLLSETMGLVVLEHLAEEGRCSCLSILRYPLPTPPHHRSCPLRLPNPSRRCAVWKVHHAGPP